MTSMDRSFGFNLRHLPSEYNISTIVVPNWTRLEPLETRHLEFSMNIKSEEKGVRKGLQTATRKLIQKSEKDKNADVVDDVMNKKGAGISVPGYTNANRPFEGAASTSVSWYTSASLNSPYKHTTTPTPAAFGKKKSCRIFCKKFILK